MVVGLIGIIWKADWSDLPTCIGLHCGLSLRVLWQTTGCGPVANQDTSRPNGRIFSSIALSGERNMLLTNLILLLALVVMVGIAIWLFRDGEGVGPTPYIRPFEDDGGAAVDDRSRSEPSSVQTSVLAQNRVQPRIRVVSDADTDQRERSDS